MAKQTANQIRKDIVAKGRSVKGQWAYRNDWVGPTWQQIMARKAADCSDFTHGLFGMWGYKLGGMSRDQAYDGTPVASWKGRRGGGVTAFNKIYTKVKAADIITMDLNGAGYATHTAMFTADKSGNIIDHGYGMGPKEFNLGAAHLLPKAYSWDIRRIVPDDTKKTTAEKKKATVNQAQKIDYIYRRFKKIASINRSLKKIDAIDKRLKSIEKKVK